MYELHQIVTFSWLNMNIIQGPLCGGDQSVVILSVNE